MGGWTADAIGASGLPGLLLRPKDSHAGKISAATPITAIPATSRCRTLDETHRAFIARLLLNSRRL